MQAAAAKPKAAEASQAASLGDPSGTNVAKESRAPTDEPIADWRARALEAESADEERLRAQLPEEVLDLAVQLGGDKHDAVTECTARVKKASRLIEKVNAARLSSVDEAVEAALAFGATGGLIGITARRMGISLPALASGAAAAWQELSTAFAPPKRKTGRPAGLTGVPQILELVAWARDEMPAGFQAKDPEKLARGLALLLVTLGIPATRKPKRPRPHDFDVVPAGRTGFLPVVCAGPRVYGRIYLTEVEYATARDDWKDVQVKRFTRLIRDAVRDEGNRDAQRRDAHVEEKS
jgi:hypothetical protein